MRRTSRIVLGTLALALLGPAGCGSRLNDDRTATVKPGVVHTIIYDPPKKEQKVTLELSSPGVPVSAYLVLAKDREAAEEAAAANRSPANALAGQQKVETATLEATIPAGAGFVLVLTSTANKDASVRVKATGR
ncbi:MAG TPA: hypothetical protein VNK04_14240 [Gemmataceae bacterium]|jgi:hypothetical protein|nr:hypothetical protein [Gemmataceae bacterium]